MADSLGVGFVDILPRADKFVSSLSSQVSKGLGTVSQQTSTTGKLVAGLQYGFIALGAAAVAGIGKAIQSTVSWAREVLSLQRVTGQSAESASALLAVMGEFGITSQQATVALGLLDKNIINNSANLTKYGIATTDAQGNLLPFDDILGAVADKFVSLDNAQKQAAFAMNVFGRSGKAMIPILRQGSAGLEELKAAAAETGLVIGQDTVDAAIKLGIEQRKLSESFKGLAVTIGTEFLPIATDLIHWAVDLVQVMTSIPGPVYEVVLGFTVLTGALAGIIKVGTLFVGTWSKVAAGLGVATKATKELQTAQLSLFSTGETSGGLLAALGFGGAAAIVVGIAAIGAELISLRNDAKAAHEEYNAGIGKDLAALAAGGQAAAGVRAVADAVKVTSLEQQNALGLTRAQVLANNKAIDQANIAWDQYRHEQALNTASAGKTVTSLQGVFKTVESGTAVIIDLTDATTLLNKNLSDAGTRLANFAKRSGADVQGILGSISKVVNDAKSTVQDVVTAYQGGIQQLVAADKQWHDSIVTAFGGAGSALDKFANKANFSFSAAVTSLAKYTTSIKNFGSDIATIQDRFGKSASDFIQWASTQGLAQSGLVAKVAESNKKMGDSFISNFNRANAATDSLANQIQQALDPTFEKIILWLKNVVRAIQGLPPIKLHADTSAAQSDIDRFIAANANRKITIAADVRAGAQGSATHWQGGFIHGFSMGGPSEDTIPAMLSPGEFVMRRSAVERIGVGALQSMNAGGAVGISKPQKLDGAMRIYDWRNGLATLDAELSWEDTVRTR